MKEETKSNEKESVLKPAWLQRLEEESWQAELALSGAAIFVAFQLPDLVDLFEKYLLLHAPDITLSLFTYISVYLWSSVTVLIALFIFHLIMRALWIGLIGLNSVFPDGFAQHKRFSADFQEKMLADYGNVDDYMKRLDNIGSATFGLGFTLFFFSLNFAFLAVVLIVIISLVTFYAPDAVWLKIIFTLLGIIFLVAAILNSLLHHPKLQHHPLVKRFHYPIYKKMMSIIFIFNNRYLISTMGMFNTYLAGQKNYWKKSILGGIMIGFIMGTAIFFDDNQKYFNQYYYHRLANDSTRIEPLAYFENTSDDVRFRPVIPTLYVKNKQQFSVWIPLPAREMEHLEHNCSLSPVDQSLSRTERRPLERQRTLECAKTYIELSLNEQPIKQFDLKTRNMETVIGDQFGIQIHISNPDFRLTTNLLTVTTQYPHPDTGEPRVAHIPFYYTPLN